MTVYNTEAELLALTKQELVDIIKYQNCILNIPEIEIYLKPQSIKNKMKKCQCCAEFCCIKVPVLN